MIMIQIRVHEDAQHHKCFVLFFLGRKVIRSEAAGLQRDEFLLFAEFSRKLKVLTGNITH